jgi:hypothetical protein
VDEGRTTAARPGARTTALTLGVAELARLVRRPRELDLPHWPEDLDIKVPPVTG